VPRDGSDTRARLLDAAEELFAQRGIYDVATSEIVADAGQRNASAVTYHFGSRSELLRALLVERDAPVDEARGALLTDLGADPTTTDLLNVLVGPYAACLHSRPGRNYLRIVDQVREGFSEWRTVPPRAQPNLATTLGMLENRLADLDPNLQQERLLGMMMLMTSSAAVRAQRIEAGQPPALDHADYIENLTAMLAGLVEAPATVQTTSR
jgi:AcrR family transcriptional regulator